MLARLGSAVAVPFAGVSSFDRQKVTAPAFGAFLPAAVLFGLRNNSSREASRLESIEQFRNMAWLEPLYDALSDQSVRVKRAAMDALRRMSLVAYRPKEKAVCDKILGMVRDAVTRYDNGRDIRAAVADLKKAGCVVLFADDSLPPRALSAEALENRGKNGGFDEDEIEMIRSGELPVTVGELFEGRQSGEFVAPRKGSPAYILLSETSGSVQPETFWHEYVHYLQYTHGLFGKKDWPMDVLFKREMEANQFIVDNADTLGVSSRGVNREISLWKHNLSAYFEATTGNPNFYQKRLDQTA